MNVIVYALLAYFATTVISLGVVGIIVLIDKISSDKGVRRNDGIN